MSNLVLLTQSHAAIAAKKRAKRHQLAQVVFDDTARREFLTGFHKRKVAKTEAARKRAAERQKQERLEARREQRRQLRERAVANAAHVESAYRELLGPGDAENEEDEDEWRGISPNEQGKQKEDEYEGQEVVATVTVVEDIDPSSFSRSWQTQPASPPIDASTSIVESARERSPPKGKAKRKTGRFRYEKKEDRKREQARQRARRTEKASRRKGGGARRKG